MEIIIRNSIFVIMRIVSFFVIIIGGFFLFELFVFVFVFVFIVVVYFFFYWFLFFILYIIMLFNKGLQLFFVKFENVILVDLFVGILNVQFFVNYFKLDFLNLEVFMFLYLFFNRILLFFEFMMLIFIFLNWNIGDFFLGSNCVYFSIGFVVVLNSNMYLWFLLLDELEGIQNMVLIMFWRRFVFNLIVYCFLLVVDWKVYLLFMKNL